MGFPTSRAVAGRARRRVVFTAIAVGLGWSVVPAREARAQRVLTVVIHDTTLEAAPTVPAGVVTVRLVPKSATRRELVVHRVPVGTTPEEVARGAAGRPERWFQQWSFGGPAAPRDSVVDANVTMDLRPGRYTLVAYEVDQAGRVRGDRFIWREMTAIAGAVLIAARFPVPDARVRVKDASIEVLGTLRAGERTLQIENAGSRPHELIVGRLKPGKRVTDVQRWTRDAAGEAPFVYVGGVTPMSSRLTAQARLDLKSGDHVVLCPMGGDHARGVMASFRVN